MKILCTLILVFFFMQICIAAPNQKDFSFALIGDMPYQVGVSTRSKKLRLLQDQINKDKSIAWVIHAGDIKTGGQVCSDKLFAARKAYFDQFRPAFIYTPGDNEWTDCNRPTSGHFDPLERLSKLREMFFLDENKKMKMATDSFSLQSEIQPFQTYRENAMWQKQRVSFATVHVVGSRNGEALFARGSKVKRTQAHDNEVKERSAAAQYWLEKSFAFAKQQKSRGLFITIHANPGLHPKAQDADKRPFRQFVQQLHRLSENFDGEVVLAHGDSHDFRIDQPKLTDAPAPSNLLRVETFGENDGNWIKVSASENNASVFSFTPILN